MARPLSIFGVFACALLLAAIAFDFVHDRLAGLPLHGGTLLGYAAFGLPSLVVLAIAINAARREYESYGFAFAAAIALAIVGGVAAGAVTMRAMSSTLDRQREELESSICEEAFRSRSIASQLDPCRRWVHECDREQHGWTDAQLDAYARSPAAQREPDAENLGSITSVGAETLCVRNLARAAGAVPPLPAPSPTP